MYADEMVLFSESIHELKKMIDVVNLYSNEYDLYMINMSKTKIVIFRNRGNCKPEEKWFLNGNHIELCNEFIYLGILFYFNGKFVQTQKDCQIKEERQFLVYLIKYKMIVTTMKHFYHCLILM
jgi:hypothetical protein